MPVSYIKADDRHAHPNQKTKDPVREGVLSEKSMHKHSPNKTGKAKTLLTECCFWIGLCVF